MDYKKKYENALEWAKQVINGECGFIRKEVEEVFPELKESEYERIRKTLIDYFKNYKTQEEIGIKTFFGIPTDDILDWLEKQGKKDVRYQHLEELLAADDIYQMSMNEAMTNEARTKAVSALSKMCISELLGLEKQGEQKELSQSKVTKISDQECSVEFDENLMMIEDRFSDYLDYIREDSSLTKHRKNTLKEEIIGYVNWLKTLKERLS